MIQSDETIAQLKMILNVRRIKEYGRTLNIEHDKRILAKILLEYRWFEDQKNERALIICTCFKELWKYYPSQLELAKVLKERGFKGGQSLLSRYEAEKVMPSMKYHKLIMDLTLEHIINDDPIFQKLSEVLFKSYN